MYNPQLETFLCVAECGSFNKAAEKLFISPPAVIKQINLLEENLNLQLFVRTHRGLQLTEAGKSLAQDAKYIIQYCKDSVTRAKNVMKKSEDIIRIGTSSMTPAQVLVDLWPKLQEECPGVKFQLVPFDNTPENAREILANLGQNIDVIAGIFDETMLNLRRCAGLEISREPICAAVSEKPKNVILWVLAIVGAVAAVAGIAYAVYRFVTPDYLEDFEDDFDDDFDDYFEDEDEDK